MKKLIFLVVLSLSILACDNETPELPANSLTAYLVEKSSFAQSNRLIACAAGGQQGFLEDQDFPVSVFFLPIENANNFKYFEASIDQDPADFSQYQSVDLELVPVFNGYLQRFLHPGGETERWGRVVYESADSIHICNAIRIKLTQKPSEFAPELVSINQSDPTSPIFSWQDGQIVENEIYFQVVSDSNGNLISGTYTYEKQFQFYDLSNVVLNIRDVNPSPVLAPNEVYKFTLMGVSIDNWVNLIAEKEFRTE